MKSPIDFYIDQLSPLVGGKITAVARTEKPEYPGEDEFFGLVITVPNGKTHTLVMLSDDEGNAPGSFEIQPD